MQGVEEAIAAHVDPIAVRCFKLLVVQFFKEKEEVHKTGIT